MSAPPNQNPEQIARDIIDAQLKAIKTTKKAKKKTAKKKTSRVKKPTTK